MICREMLNLRKKNMDTGLKKKLSSLIYFHSISCILGLDWIGLMDRISPSVDVDIFWTIVTNVALKRNASTFQITL